MAPVTSDQTHSARDKPRSLSDPRALKALAHPLRMRLIGELSTRGSMRAVDLANAVDEPANSVSFHLRQLAKYGVIEQDDDRAADGRERWWRMPSDQGFRINPAELASLEGGEAALSVFRRVITGNVHALARVVHGTTFAPDDTSPDRHLISNDFAVRLSADEMDELKDDMFDLMMRWMARSRELAEVDDGVERRTVYAVMLGAPLDLIIDQPSQKATAVDESVSDD